MPQYQYQQPDYNDPLLRLQRRVAALERTVAALAANSRPTLPTYTDGEVTNLTLNDGEAYILISDQNLYYEVNGQLYQLNGLRVA